MPRTAKFFSFQFVSTATIPDTSVVAITAADAWILGVLSSRMHRLWALATGGTLEDRPRYQHKLTFNTFPFPASTDAQSARIRDLAEQIDAHRKRQQAQHPDLTLTGLYNVLEKLHAGAPLTAKERTIHDHGLVSVLRELHDELDRAVFEAYGWSDLALVLVGRPGATTPLTDKPAGQAAAEEELLSRLVRLNAERAAEEARGLVRWLRPELQNPQGSRQAMPTQGAIGGQAENEAASPAAAPRRPWPARLPEQIRAVAELVAVRPAGMTLDELGAAFTGRGARKRLPPIVESLEALGRVQITRDGRQIARVTA